MKLKTKIFTLFSLCVTLGVLWYFFRHISPRDVLETILNVDRNALLVFILLSFSMSAFRTWRYLVALRPAGYSPRSSSMFLVVLVRNFFSDLLPARLGTTVYMYLVTSRLGIPLQAAASSFALAFIFDIIAIVPMALLAVYVLHGTSELSTTGILVGSGFVGAIALGLLTFLPHLSTYGRKVIPHLPLPPHWKENLSQIVDGVRIELLSAQRAGIYFRLLLLSVLVRLCKYASLYFFLYGLLKPLGYTLSQLPVSKVFLGLILPEFAASLPVSGIAGIGAYEGVWEFTFRQIGFAPDIAKLTAISHHLFTQVYGYTIGAGALLFLSLPVFKVSMAKSQSMLSSESNFYFLKKLVSGTLFVLACSYLSLTFSLAAEPPKPSKDYQQIPTPLEAAKRKKLADTLSERIVFDSNMSGTFGIYSTDIEGKNLLTLVDSDWHETYPDPSPDGRFLVFARSRTTARLAPSEIWILNLSNGTSRKLADDATFPTFSSTGKTIYFERKRKSVHEIGLDGTRERKIFPIKGSGFKNYAVVKPRISPDGTRVAFTSDRPNRWNAWFSDLRTGKSTRIEHGCEPAWYSNGKELAWIRTSDMEAKSGVGHFTTNTQKEGVLVDDGAPRGHEYFPSLTTSDQFLLYAACPADEHSHTDANYEIFVRDTRAKESVQITFNGRTNRWPKLLKRP